MKATQLERITRMEQRLDLVNRAVADFSQALEQYVSVQEAIKALDHYYGSDEWQDDYDDDSAGRLPNDLKRGVLSEDGVWNALADVRELNERLTDVVEKLSLPPKEML